MNAKKIFVGLVAMLGAATMALAQPGGEGIVHRSGSFLGEGILAVYVTNTIAVTNLNTPGGNPTNVAGISFTNNVRTRLTTTATAYTNVNLLGSVPLTGRPDGDAYVPATNALTGGYLSPATLSVTMKGGSGANAAVRFTFKPVWDGVNVDSSGAQDWTAGLTATASSTITVSTNVPLWLWPGAKALQLSRVVNADTDASSEVIVSAVKLNFYGPPK